MNRLLLAVFCCTAALLGEVNFSKASKLELRDSVQQALQAKDGGFLRKKGGGGSSNSGGSKSGGSKSGGSHSGGSHSGGSHSGGSHGEPTSPPTSPPVTDPPTNPPVTDPPTGGNTDPCEAGFKIVLTPFDFSKATVPVNNLGDFCGNGAEPGGTSDCGGSVDPYIVYEGVGSGRTGNGDQIPITLVVKVSSGDYVPSEYNVDGDDGVDGPNTNGYRNNGVLGEMGQVNVRNGHKVSLDFEFRDGYGAGSSAVSVSGYFAFFDVDALCYCENTPPTNNCMNPDDCPNCYNKNGEQYWGADCVSVSNADITDPNLGDDSYGDIVLTTNPETSLCMDSTTEPGRTIFYGTKKGDGADNTNSWINPDGAQFENGGFPELTFKQNTFAGMFGFVNQDSLQIDYEVTGAETQKGRNLVFSAQLYLCLPDLG